jgi:hypothetical protein
MDEIHVDVGTSCLARAVLVRSSGHRANRTGTLRVICARRNTSWISRRKGEIIMKSEGAQVPQQPSNPALERLSVFAGEWDIEIMSMSFEADKTAVVRGRASFAWVEGGACLLEHFEAPDTEFPRSTSIIGPDDSAETYGMLYFDSRGVSRIYQMSFDGNVWKL